MQRLVGGYYEIATNQADREEPLEFDYNKMLTGADPGGPRGHVHAPCADGHSQTQRNVHRLMTYWSKLILMPISSIILFAKIWLFL